MTRLYRITGLLTLLLTLLCTSVRAQTTVAAMDFDGTMPEMGISSDVLLFASGVPPPPPHSAQTVQEVQKCGIGTPRIIAVNPDTTTPRELAEALRGSCWQTDFLGFCFWSPPGLSEQAGYARQSFYGKLFTV